jgi:hypothetical protein
VRTLWRLSSYEPLVCVGSLATKLTRCSHFAAGPPAECCPGKHYKQAKDTLLMRQIIPTSFGAVRLGNIFWFAGDVPVQWVQASQKLGFRTRGEMGATTVGDMATLGPEMQAPLPCGPRKCEACVGGCQVWDSIPSATQPFIGNERAHYEIPRSDADMILSASLYHNDSRQMMHLWDH